MKKPLAERLREKLRKLGLTERKATALAKGVAVSTVRAKVQGSVTTKLTARLIKLGVSERKATELAKGLAPIVRASIKAKVKAQAKTLAEVYDDEVNDVVTEVTNAAEDEELDAVAPRVDGHRVRLDLPVVRRHAWQGSPTKGVELLRVMDGLTSEATYLVAAVKKDIGIVAVRQLDKNCYNVKFYPTMTYWGYQADKFEAFGSATDYLEREWYHRMHFTREGMDVLLKYLEEASKPKVIQLMKRMLAVSGRTLVKAFDYLHKRERVA